MQDYIIGEDYTLPSLGKVYKNVEVNPHIKIRSMTTNEEMKRLNPSDRPYKVMADIIDDCLVEKAGISAYDMCIGDYQFLLYKLRTVTYGPDYAVDCSCPYCLTTTKESINLDELPVKKYDESIEELLEFDLPKTQHHIRLRMQTPRLLDEVSIQTKKFNRKTKQALESDTAFLFTLKSLIELIDDEEPDKIFFEDWIRNLPAADANYIKRKAQKVIGAIGVENDFEIQCPVCGLTYNSSFRVSTDFFDPEIDE